MSPQDLDFTKPLVYQDNTHIAAIKLTRLAKVPLKANAEQTLPNMMLSKFTHINFKQLN